MSEELEKAPKAKKTTEAKKPTEAKKTTKKASTTKASTTKTTAKTTKKPATKKADATKTKLPTKKVEEKKSLDDLLKEPKKETEHKEVDHVEVLRKKREAQKKLNEELLKEKELKEKAIQIKQNEVILEIEKEPVVENEVNELKEELSLLKEQLKTKEELLVKQDDELKNKDEQIIVLTNSLLSEKETVKKEELDYVDNQGDILLRIRLFNKKIAEKEEQLKLVEDELNSLTEKDIFEKEFILQVKNLRDNRNQTISQANYELNGLAGIIKLNEEKLNSKKQLIQEKENELKKLEDYINNAKLLYSEKEVENRKRTPIIAFIDALKIEIENLTVDYDKLIARYKERLKKAEVNAFEYSQIESQLINIYLTKLREQKSNENYDYQYQKSEHKALLKELERLNSLYDKIKNTTKLDLIVVDGELDELKKQLASLEGKLSKLYLKRNEREEAEVNLRTKDEVIKAYVDAFSNLEYLNLSIVELRKEISRIEDMDEVNIKLTTQKHRLEIFLKENLEKIEYLSGVVSKYSDDEKVKYYKQLLESIAILDEHEVILSEKVNELKGKILIQESY